MVLSMTNLHLPVRSTLHVGLFLLIWLGLIILSYFYLDRTVVNIAYEHNWQSFTLLKWMTYISSLAIITSVVAIIYYVIKQSLRLPIAYRSRVFFIAGINTLVTAQLNSLLKVIFGRTWPATWTHNNPSWLSNHVYGFNLFHGGQKAYQSFPSGHTAIIFAMMTVLWIGLPRWRWLYAILSFAVCIGLISMYYHFVSDVLAGAGFGIITGQLATSVFLQKEKSNVKLL